VSVPTLQLQDVCWTSKITGNLPETYTDLPATGDVTCDLPVSTVNTSPTSSAIDTFRHLEPWLTAVESSVSDELKDSKVAFASYHAQANTQPVTAVCNDTLLPLLRDHIQSPATVRHLMNVITHIVSTVNNGQAPVITADQPVYAVAKYIQWKYPDRYGEDKMVVMMGGLHIEMAVQNMIGKWLKGSGWADIFFKAEVATAGRCDALLKSSHVKRYAHEVRIASLFIVRNEVFKADMTKGDESLETWVACRSKESS